VRSDQFGQNFYVDSQIDVTKNNLPFFNFNNDNNKILNIYIPHFPLFGKVKINLTTQDITTPANIKALYKLGIDYLKGHFNSGAKKDFVVTYQKTPTEIEVLYFGEHYKKLNDNKIKRDGKKRSHDSQ